MTCSSTTWIRIWWCQASLETCTVNLRFSLKKESITTQSLPKQTSQDHKTDATPLQAIQGLTLVSKTLSSDWHSNVMRLQRSRKSNKECEEVSHRLQLWIKVQPKTWHRQIPVSSRLKSRLTKSNSRMVGWALFKHQGKENLSLDLNRIKDPRSFKTHATLKQLSFHSHTQTFSLSEGQLTVKQCLQLINQLRNRQCKKSQPVTHLLWLLLTTSNRRKPCSRKALKALIRLITNSKVLIVIRGPIYIWGLLAQPPPMSLS